MKPVQLSAAAELDIAEAASYFEQQQEGLGVLFIRRVNEAVDKIAKTPLVYATLIGDARRVMTRQFRYHVWYRVLADESIVIGCIHTSRDPQLAEERATRNPLLLD